MTCGLSAVSLSSGVTSLPSWHEFTCWGAVVVVVEPPLAVVAGAARALAVGVVAGAVVVPFWAGRTTEIGLASIARRASAFFLVVVVAGLAPAVVLVVALGGA